MFGQVARGLHGSPFPASGPDAAALVGCLSEGPSTGSPSPALFLPNPPVETSAHLSSPSRGS